MEQDRALIKKANIGIHRDNCNPFDTYSLSQAIESCQASYRLGGSNSYLQAIDSIQQEINRRYEFQDLYQRGLENLRLDRFSAALNDLLLAKELYALPELTQLIYECQERIETETDIHIDRDPLQPNNRQIGADRHKKLELIRWLTKLGEHWNGDILQIEYLDLHEKQLTSLPESIDLLTNLHTLYLDRNQLTSIPESLVRLTDLQELSLGDNQLTSIPASFTQLTNLQELCLYGNQLTSIPASFAQLTNLRELYLCDNQLTSIPECLVRLTNLHTIDISRNPIADLSILQKFNHPDLLVRYAGVNLPRRYWTKLSDWQPEWLLSEGQAEIRRVLIQKIGYNRISVGSAIEVARWLAEIGLKEDGTLANFNTPVGVNWEGTLTDLHTLSVNDKRLTSLPEGIGTLINLQSLDLGYNRLTSLPESLGQLTNLHTLSLHDNRLTTLPKSLGQLTNLHILSLCDNWLTTLPEWLGQLTKLEDLNLSINRLTSLPESIGQFNHLHTLDLSSNQLTSLPESLGQFNHLHTLNLSSNQLTSLPESIGQFNHLHTLNLTSNRLTDLSLLQELNEWNLRVYYFGVDLPHRYWTKFSDWEPEWLLDENNAEIRRVLIQQVGYEKICDRLGAEAIDIWQEYTLLSINGIQPIYESFNDPIYYEPMVLLKMTCPSTGHIHILRVPPEMTSAQAAITWVNHGIHPSDIAIQT